MKIGFLLRWAIGGLFMAASFSLLSQNTIDSAVDSSINLFLNSPQIFTGYLDDELPGDAELRCLDDVVVNSFAASPNTIEPFESTTLTTDVDIPSGCPISLSLGGEQQIPRRGMTTVFPVRTETVYRLVGRINQVPKVLATSNTVTVDQTSCNQVAISEERIVRLISEEIVKFVNADSRLRLTGPNPIRIQVNSSGLSIKLSLKATELQVTSEVDLNMTLKFIVRNGVIEPRYLLFRPQVIGSKFPDDFVSNAFFSQADSILASFAQAFNNAMQSRIGIGERLLDFILQQNMITAVICGIDAPQLSVLLSVSPSDTAPATFALLIDGQIQSPRAMHNQSSNPIAVREGVHSVSDRPVAPTNGRHFSTRYGGDCNAFRNVELRAGERKQCVVTKTFIGEDQCLVLCADSHQQCIDDPEIDIGDCQKLNLMCMDECE